MWPARVPFFSLGSGMAVEIAIIVADVPPLIALAAGDRALLLSDDRDVERFLIFEPEKTVPLTTWDYLRQLEEAQRIQSADAVIDAVRQAGRNPPTRALWDQHDPEIREAVKAIITRTHTERD